MKSFCERGTSAAREYKNHMWNFFPRRSVAESGLLVVTGAKINETVSLFSLSLLQLKRRPGKAWIIDVCANQPACECGRLRGKFMAFDKFPRALTQSENFCAKNISEAQACTHVLYLNVGWFIGNFRFGVSGERSRGKINLFFGGDALGSASGRINLIGFSVVVERSRLDR